MQIVAIGVGIKDHGHGKENKYMFDYRKKLQFPIDIKKRDLKFAKILITQYGGPEGELGAALRYLNQRYL